MSDPVLRDIDDHPRAGDGGDVRMSLRLSPEAKQTLDWIANRRHVSYAEAIRRALGTEKFLLEIATGGGRILIEKPGERLRELVLI